MPVLYFRILACLLISGVSTTKAPADDPLYVAKPFTAEGSFTPGVEGPAVDRDGNFFAVNFGSQQTVGKVGAEEACAARDDAGDGTGILRHWRVGLAVAPDFGEHFAQG